MSFAIPLLIIILLAVVLLAGLIIFASARAYNKRMDKITKGEVRGTHSAIPDPATTITAVFRIVITVVVFISFVFICSIYGRVYGLPDRLQTEMHNLSAEISELNSKMDSLSRTVSRTEYELKGIKDNKANVRYETELRSFSEDTKVTLILNGEEYLLEKETPGIYKTEFQTDLFALYSDSKILICENGKTTVENADFPEALFWDALPLPQLTNNTKTEHSLFGSTYGGEYILKANDPSDIKSASVTDVIDGKETVPLDATESIKNGTPVAYGGIPDGKDYVLRIVVNTVSGYVIKYDIALFTTQESSENIRIEDTNGSLLYSCEY